MEELIGRYFFIVVVIFATVMDLVGRWYKHRQRRDRRLRRTPQAESREPVVDWRKTRAPEPAWRQAATARDREKEAVEPSERSTGLPDFAQILLDELGPPASWTEVPRPGGSQTPVEQPMIARVVPKPRLSARSTVKPARQPARSTMPSQTQIRTERARVRSRSLATLRAALVDPGAARRAVVLAEVLGPCRGMELRRGASRPLP